ncbi:hypothetical protein ES703_17634 [subsurface metagenome]
MRQTERDREIRGVAEQSYDQLEGEWLDWLEVARKYEHKVLSQDRLDIRHIILLELYHARQRDNKPIPILRAYRIASLMVALYWRQLKRQPTMLSLEADIQLDEGEIVQLKDTVADDNAIDLSAWLDEETFLLGCPMRLIEIAHKKSTGKPLSWKDHKYWERTIKKERARYQKTLF